VRLNVRRLEWCGVRTSPGLSLRTQYLVLSTTQEIRNHNRQCLTSFIYGCTHKVMSKDTRAVINWLLTLAAAFSVGFWIRGGDWLCAAMACVTLLLSMALVED